MSIKALAGGERITGITPGRAHSTYDGVWLEFRGTTLRQGEFKPNGITIEMSQVDAIDLALALILAAEKHGEEAAKRVPLLVKRLNKMLARKEKA